jgi:hypothetical protein
LCAKCDLIASILNPNRSFSATLCQKTEITSEFGLAFNKFGATMGGNGTLQGIQDGAKRGAGQTQSRPEGVMGKTTRSGAAHRMASGVLADLAEFAHSLARSLFDPYRPELYYMRGPGPKWHAKHDRAPVAYQAVPALVRVRAKR